MEWIISFVKAQPLIFIIVSSFIITFFLTWLYKKFTNQEKHKEYAAKQKELREKSKLFKNQPEKLLEMQKEMMQGSMEQMRESFKPLIISFVPIMLAFIFLKWAYTEANVGDIISWHVNLPLFGTGAGWFLSYIILSLIFNSILRKILKVY